MKSYPLYEAYRAVLTFFTDWKGRAKPAVIVSPNPLPLDGLLRINVENVAYLSVCIEVLTMQNAPVQSRLVVPTTADYATAFRLPAGLKTGMYQVVVKVFGRKDERVWLALEEADLPTSAPRPPAAAPTWFKRVRSRWVQNPGQAQLMPALLLALSVPGVSVSLHAQELSAAPAPSSEASPWAPAPQPPVTVSGRVVDERGLPLAGATVVAPGSHELCSTNATGNFLLTTYPKGAERLCLSISYLGYLDVQLPVSAAFLNVAMAPAPGAKKYRENGKVRRYRRHLKPN